MRHLLKSPRSSSSRVASSRGRGCHQPCTGPGRTPSASVTGLVSGGQGLNPCLPRGAQALTCRTGHRGQRSRQHSCPPGLPGGRAWNNPRKVGPEQMGQPFRLPSQAEGTAHGAPSHPAVLDLWPPVASTHLWARGVRPPAPRTSHSRRRRAAGAHAGKAPSLSPIRSACSLPAAGHQALGGIAGPGSLGLSVRSALSRSG